MNSNKRMGYKLWKRVVDIQVSYRKLCYMLGEALVVEFWWGEVVSVSISREL